jgi:flagellar basal-body rod modification protein FlgD
VASSFDTTIRNLGLATQTNEPKVSAVKNQSLGQDDFLKLMTAQLRNQDPFAPVDNTQMVAQMAQFSSLAGISEMSSTLKAISDKLGATSTADALGYVGRTVLTEGTTAFGRTAGGIAGGVELGADADAVDVTIADANGRALRTINLGARKAGAIEFDWDGKGADGADAGPGPFTVSVFATGADGPVPAKPLVWAPVQSVSLVSGSPVLDVAGLGPVPVPAVRKVG